MGRLLTVGEFSRLTHLTVKALRHYHESGVLEPARVDASSGYRYYSPEQVDDAQLVRRLRQVRMPLADVRAVLDAPDDDARRAGIATHLDHLRLELAETAAAVASLQALLAGDPPSVPVAYRRVPDVPCLTLSADLEQAGLAGWCAEAYPRLATTAATSGLVPAGPAGALYGEGWFELGGGPVTAFLPVSFSDQAGRALPPPLGPAPPGGVRASTVPGQDVAVALHCGGFEDIDRTYAILGRHVLDRHLAGRGPIREVYVVGPDVAPQPDALRTEICWPVQLAPDPAP